MELHMTVGVEKYEVLCSVGTPFTSPDHMMAVPAGNLGYFLVAHRTEALLFLP